MCTNAAPALAGSCGQNASKFLLFLFILLNLLSFPVNLKLRFLFLKKKLSWNKFDKSIETERQNMKISFNLILR